MAMQGLLDLVLLAQQSDVWNDTLFGVGQTERFPLLALIIGCATGVICTALTLLSSTIKSVHRLRTEVDLKREMIERGMSAEEIATVIEAALPLEDGTQRWIASWGKSKRGKS
jgi:hypothetical protein